MITYLQLKEKFLDKGYGIEFHYLVCPAPYFDPQRCLMVGISLSDLFENWEKSVRSVYGKDWEYWSTWIDYQQHKF